VPWASRFFPEHKAILLEDAQYCGAYGAALYARELQQRVDRPAVALNVASA
jgi:hypothetical protein